MQSVQCSKLVTKLWIGFLERWFRAPMWITVDSILPELTMDVNPGGFCLAGEDNGQIIQAGQTGQ